MFRDMQFLFPDYVKYGEFRMSMMSDEHEFIKSGLIEHVSAGGFRQIDHFKMTEEGKKRLLEGVDLTLSRNEDMPDGAIKPESISPKEALLLAGGGGSGRDTDQVARTGQLQAYPRAHGQAWPAQPASPASSTASARHGQDRDGASAGSADGTCHHAGGHQLHQGQVCR